MTDRTLRLINLTWAIPEHIGGMTSTMFMRSAMLHDAGYPVETVLLGPEQDRARDAERLRADGVLPAGGTLLNLWDVLADAAPDASGKAPDGVRPIPAGEDGAREWSDAGAMRIRTRYAADGEILQRDHFRPDGTLLVVDERAHRSGGKPRRRVTLFDRVGRPLRSWRSIWGLYAFGLDLLLGGDRAVLFLDSKVSAPFGAGYRRPGVGTIHVIHNLHLRPGSAPPFAELNESRTAMMRELFRYDRVVCSTERQRDDIGALLGPVPNVVVIPPATEPVTPGPAPREAGRGVVLASLIERKRIEDIVRAVARARALAPGAGIRLDVYGTGEAEPELRRLIAEEGLEGVVELRGYRQGARETFATASWTALTSTHEGFGMALAEAMSGGCVPFAYGIPYGPSDLLAATPDHLVAPGAVDELAARIAGFATSPEDAREALRERVEAAARKYAPEHVSAAWRRLVADLDAALPENDPPAAEPKSRALRIRRTPAGVEIEADFGLHASKPLPRVQLGVAAEHPPIEWRREAEVRRLRGARYRARVMLPGEAFPLARERADAVVAVIDPAPGRRRRILLEGVDLDRNGTVSTGVRGARRVVRAVRRRLARLLRRGS